MTCRKARKLIPLLAGDDLPPWRSRRVRAHIERCPSCRNDLKEHTASLAEIKALAGVEKKKDWSETEWKKLIRRAVSQKPEKRPIVPGLRPAAAWAATFTAVLVLGLVLFFNNADFKTVKISAISGEQTAKKAGPPAGGSSHQEKREQDVVSVTLVAQDTGLKVVWFFDKKFEWKEKGI